MGDQAFGETENPDAVCGAARPIITLAPFEGLCRTGKLQLVNDDGVSISSAFLPAKCVPRQSGSTQQLAVRRRRNPRTQRHRRIFIADGEA